ncbi:hypothetical protein G6F61_014492 [Rhizopus arrhizus]|nr:hypothetical protein G6F31_019527 [Rhizopus arrhizus]KAG1358300.1 hypothetical protein G6F61_014492 [Rhizopus arrhizus]
MFSWRDCQQGLLVFGAIGSGKSYAALRPIARRFRKAALAMACVASDQGDVRERLTRQKLAGGALIADAWNARGALRRVGARSDRPGIARCSRWASGREFQALDGRR